MTTPCPPHPATTAAPTVSVPSAGPTTSGPAHGTDELVGRLRAAGCVFAEEEAALLRDASSDPAQLDAWCRRREAGEPLEPIVGWVDFAGDRYQLGPGVFVPRRRSEHLVERALSTLPTAPRGPVVLVEMCCGIGAIGLAIVRQVVGRGQIVQAHLADVDAEALRWARRNAAEIPTAVPPQVHQGDLWSALPTDLRGRVDLVVANAPYVPSDELPFLPPEARLHEPRAALDGGADGVDVHRRIVADAPRWLRPGGSLIIETAHRQADLTAGSMSAVGFTVRIDHDPERAATAVTGRRDGPAASATG